MKVRFRKQYSDSEPRMAYELVSDEPLFGFGGLEECYHTKLIGLVPVRKMEITTDPTDEPAINVFVRLSNLSNK